jgi:UDP-N-acetylglucosamine 2-epimerase (non-hydrolysing)
MKVAPVMAALAGREGVTQSLVHTGQHYDANMSELFFRQLGLPEPDVNLEVGSASHAMQTAWIMMRFEEFVVVRRPDLVLVYGDVNSTVAAALVCAKLLIPVGHVEAGLRSFDRTMPEEINRLLADQISDLLFTPSAEGDENLRREGVSQEKIHLVGNVMIDTLVRLLPNIAEAWELRWLSEWGKRRYALATLHRPSNVDEPGLLANIMNTLAEISGEIPVLFPVHPRTRNRIAGCGLPIGDCVHLLEPLGYLDFMALQRHATLVITDSGGVQEETTFLGVPCLTIRENTERPITVTEGTNLLVGQDMRRLSTEVSQILARNGKKGEVPPLWDGCAAQRIADIIEAWAEG